ncbi:LAFA_0F03136g1_1 [Lachancea sp. 'fantastica']|nr:LAFA_0F03136g1_1 [Lachancea sp. 'fantastica']
MIEPTPSQQDVIMSKYEPGTTIKVVAGPGSGKTLTLMLKVRELVLKGSVKPDEILILSLTNKAVDNATEKLSQVFQENTTLGIQDGSVADIVSQINVSTLHGLANRVVVENEGLINIIEENGWRSLLKLIPPAILRKLGPNKAGAALTPKMFERLFRNYQIAGKSKTKDATMERIISIMRGSKVVTNDELIVLAAKHLEQARSSSIVKPSDSFAQDLLDKYKVIVVDEFQDLFPSLLPFLESISRGKQLILFGDPHQSIYGFLGNNRALMQSLENCRSSQGLKTYHLRDNFRSTPEISGFSSSLISPDVPAAQGKFYSKPPMGLQPLAIQTNDPNEELEILIREISRMVTSSARFSDIAILARTNAQVGTVAGCLKAYGIPFEKLTAQPDWISDKGVKFLTDLIKLCVLVGKEERQSDGTNQPTTFKSDFSVIITLSASKGLSNNALQALFAEARESNISLWNVIANGKISSVSAANKTKIRNFVNHVNTLMIQLKANPNPEPIALISTVADTAYRLGFLAEGIKSSDAADTFKSHIAEWLKALKLCSLSKPDNVPSIEWFLETQFDQNHASSTSLVSNGNQDLGAVKLSTIHSSKGLEFPIVFLLGSSSSAYAIEKNALYVGITRARNILYMSNISDGLLPKLISCNGNRHWNKQIWSYYNSDLKRPCVMSTAKGLDNFTSLTKKYGLNSPSRTYCNFALRASHSLKYILR